MSLTVDILGTVSTATVQQIRPPVDVVDYPANELRLSWPAFHWRSSGDGCGRFNRRFQKEREGGVSLSRGLAELAMIFLKLQEQPRPSRHNKGQTCKQHSKGKEQQAWRCLRRLYRNWVESALLT